MPALAVIGHLARDVVAGGEARIGGGPWHAGRALAALGRNALLVVKCGETEREAYSRELGRLGLPVSLATGGETTAFSFSYDEAKHRTMRVEAVGEPWRPEELALPDDVRWLHVAPLLRDDFSPAALAALARGRRLLLDGQGLVRARRVGPLVLDADFDPVSLRHVSVLKLAEEEARAVVGDDGALERLRDLGVPEVVVTFGLEGSLVLADGEAERIQARPVDADPTGAGDAFSVAYLAARSDGAAPVAAARRASELVARLLERATPG